MSDIRQTHKAPGVQSLPFDGTVANMRTVVVISRRVRMKRSYVAPIRRYGVLPRWPQGSTEKSTETHLTSVKLPIELFFQLMCLLQISGRRRKSLPDSVEGIIIFLGHLSG